MVIYALREMPGKIHPKQDVLRYIREHRLYAVESEDKRMYASKNEWKSDTLLCWGRKHAVMDNLGWMFHHDEKDSWEITREGLEALDDTFARFQNKRLAIHRCFMWRPEFKKIVDPSYIPSKHDWPRPRSVKEGILREGAEED